MAKQLFIEISECHPILSSRKPLAVGIKNTIKEIYPAIRSRDLYQLMSFICKNDTYLKATVAGDARYSLDGTESGAVTVEQAAYAMEILGRRKRDGKRRASPCVSTHEKKVAEKVPEKPRFSTILTLKKKAAEVL